GGDGVSSVDRFLIDAGHSFILAINSLLNEGQDHEQVERVQSAASTIRAKIINQQKQAENQFSTTPWDRMNVDPMQAHNFAKAGLNSCTTEALQHFANVRLPNPKGKGKRQGFSSYCDATGKLAFLWVPGQAEIDLLTKFLILLSWSDIEPVRVLQFWLLQHDEDKYFVMQSEVLAIMGELAIMFERELPKSRKANEREYPKLTLSRELAVPPGVASLGRCQLHELLANTQYHQERPEYFTDKRIGMSTTARERFTTSAPAQSLPTGSTYSAPPTRRGRSSDERDAQLTQIPLGPPEREASARQVTVDFFEQLQTAGLLYPTFALGYDQAGDVIDPALARCPEWNRVDADQRAVCAACIDSIIQPERVINMIPSHGNLHGFTSFDTLHVQCYLAGRLQSQQHVEKGEDGLLICFRVLYHLAVVAKP
ncbi:HERC2, partial [Symbiodinium microadriaticum]